MPEEFMPENQGIIPRSDTVADQNVLKQKAEQMGELINKLDEIAEKEKELLDDTTKEFAEPQADVQQPPPQQPEMPQSVGSLFNAINYSNPADIPVFIDKMQGRDAIFIVISAARLGYEKQIYSLLEAEVLSKAIRVLTTPPSTAMPMEPEKTEENPQ